MQSIREAGTRLTLNASIAAARLQYVPCRHGRKPSWLGFAKSKLYKVPKPLDWSTPEKEEMFLLKQHHDTYMKSLRAFQERAYAYSVEQYTAHAKEISEDGEIGKIRQEIERDNAIVRARREKALVQDWKGMEENIIRQRTAYEEEEIRRQEVTANALQVEMERLKSSIKLADLDAKIAEALATPIDHNFALDRTGNLYFGRNNSDKVFETTKKNELQF